MRNRMYGGVRGRKTKVGGKPTFVFLLLDSAHSEHLKLLQCIGKFIRIHKNVGKSVGKIILN